MNKFFKLPLNKLINKIPGMEKGFNESQLAMVEGLENHRFWVHISARRTGKSYAAAILALAKLLEPNSQVMVVAPNFSLSSIIWDYVTTFIKILNIECDKFNVKDKVVVLINGSTFRLLSANNRDSLVGRAAHLLIIDEAAIIDNDEYFQRDLRPALSTYADSRCLFISTPRGQINYLYEYYKKGQDESESEWGSGLYTWTSNPLLREKDINEARRNLTKNLFEQEYLCSWISTEGQIFDIREEDHFADLSELKESLHKFEVIAGLDIGYRDETAFVVILVDAYDNYFVVDEYVNKEGTTSVHAGHIKDLQTEWKVESIFIDSAAQQSKADLAYDFDIYCDNAIKSVNDGIAALQVLFEKNRIKIDEKCSVTVRSVQGYRWNDATEKQKPKHDENTHCCDAIRYAIYSYMRNKIGIYGG